MKVPARLSNRHKVAAYLYAAGKRQTEIAELLGYHPNRLSIITKSPLFQAYVREIQGELRGRVVDNVADVTRLLAEEAEPSVRKLALLRDGASEERTQLGAAKSLLEFAVPKRSIVDEDRTVRVKFDGTALERMARVLDEVPPVEAEFAEVEPDDGDDG